MQLWLQPGRWHFLSYNFRPWDTSWVSGSYSFSFDRWWAWICGFVNFVDSLEYFNFTHGQFWFLVLLFFLTIIQWTLSFWGLLLSQPPLFRFNWGRHCFLSYNILFLCRKGGNESFWPMMTPSICIFLHLLPSCPSGKYYIAFVLYLCLLWFWEGKRKLDHGLSWSKLTQKPTWLLSVCSSKYVQEGHLLYIIYTMLFNTDLKITEVLLVLGSQFKAITNSCSLLMIR